MACQAGVCLTFEDWRLSLFLLQRVEDHPQFGIASSNLDQSSLHESQMKIIVKVNGSRRLRRDLVILKTRAAERKNLRRRRNLQSVQQRLQVPPSILKLQFVLARIELCLQL